MRVYRQICQHCRKKTAWQARTLCSRCYRLHRHLYPITSKFARVGHHGHGLRITGYRSTDLPTILTDAKPGTEAKLAILESRAKQGIALFHPDEPTLKPGGEAAGVLTGRLWDFCQYLSIVRGFA